MRMLQQVINDDRLSLAAKGLYGYMMAYPRSWTLKGAAEKSISSPKAANAALRELMKTGYIKFSSANEPPS